MREESTIYERRITIIFVVKRRLSEKGSHLMQSHLAFLHTSPVHVDTFNRLIAEAALELP